MSENFSIWLDVTTLYLWQDRPAVGIVRTEKEICRRFLDQDEAPTRFCYFDKSASAFFEIGTDRLALLLAPPPPPSAASHATHTPETLEGRLKNAALRVLGHFPASWRLPAIKFLAAHRPRVMRIAYLLGILRRRIFSRAVAPARPLGEPVRFAAGDVYVSMGLDWDHKDLDWLFREKRKLGFSAILFCYDFIPYKFPQLFSGDVSARFARYFVNLAWCADTVFCISQHTRRDFDAFLEESHHSRRPSREVIRLGCDIAAPDRGRIGATVKELLNQDFTLFVSTIERRKNHETLYRAYTRLIDEGMKDVPLLIFAGMRGWGIDDLLKDISLDPRVQGKIRVLNHINDDELSALYEHALFTVYPSLYEGWGLPVAESLAHGKFCLASNAASIPEVGGDLVEYLDPWNVPAWASRLRDLFSHREEVRRLNDRVKAEYRPPTWDQAANAVLHSAIRLASGKQV